MAGGMGRAQGAWDEMVFRSMVRDGSHFYDPLGLVAEGTKIDFQVEVNSYLYGTRFMTYLAYEYGPERLVEWISRHDGSKRYYEAQFEHVYGKTLDAGVGRLDRVGARFPEGQPRGRSAVPHHTRRGHFGPPVRLDLPGLFRRRPGEDLRRLQLPRRGLAPGLDLRLRAVRFRRSSTSRTRSSSP